MKNFFQIWKEKIKKILPLVHIEHVGGTNIPGAKTKGDLDISVQTTEADFSESCDKMRQLANVHHPELWEKDFAIFNTYDQNIKIDIMLVVKGSRQDTFVKTRDTLISNPALLAEYNLIKERFVALTPEYYAAKKALFDKILAE